LIENPDNVVAINCRAGKGRTGTIICCYLLFSKRFSEPDQVFEFYSKKRFNVGEGVTQPSQKKYVCYFSHMLKEKIYFPLVRDIKAILINKIPGKNSETIKPYFEIFKGNGDKISFSNKTSYLDQKKIFSNDTSSAVSITDNNFNLTVCGDLTIKLYNNLMMSTKKLGRISFNTAFLKKSQTELIFKIEEIDPDNLIKQKYIPKDFEIQIKFQKPCDCRNRELPINLCNDCSINLVNELNDWKEINIILEVNFIKLRF
jgi:phosphatidylinositol-3,4,5-trisphosphate 3-phosphatase/dual-specificity protein phosphatase PTEN